MFGSFIPYPAHDLTEMMWPLRPWAASAHSITALSCGYPTPVFFRVVHTEPEKNVTRMRMKFSTGVCHWRGGQWPPQWTSLPGPIPTLMMSAPERISSSTISPVTTFPAWDRTIKTAFSRSPLRKERRSCASNIITKKSPWAPFLDESLQRTLLPNLR